MLRRVHEVAGLVIINDEGEQVAKSTLHGLRHTHATILLNSGQNVKVIAERLGNTPADKIVDKKYNRKLDKNAE